MSNQKKIVIAFLGNANHDSRVVNLIESLTNNNFDVKTISFDWKTKNFESQIGDTSIYRLDKSKSSLTYYLNFMFLLTKFLMKNKAYFYFAEDIYTLPVVYFFSKLNKGKIFYNSREIYAHLAGLRNKSTVQKIIAKIENKFIRKVDHVLVTGKMDEEFLSEAYSINNFIVLRNLPKYQSEIPKIDLRQKFNIHESDKILLYQGVLLEGRGILKIINILDQLPSIHFIIIGEGEFRQMFEDEAKSKTYSNRIHFLGAVPHSELLKYSASADVGLALIENISVSYYYALPNKLFEYIMAGVPTLSSNLPQMKKVIDDYKVGEYVDPENENEIISSLKELLKRENHKKYSENCQNAAKELNWETEFEKLKKLL